MSNDVIGGAHRVLVVFDDQHRVAEVTQTLERHDQLVVVALMQADRGLVEDVEHADQRRPDLGRQADALRLPARQRRRCAFHAEVADADVLQEAESLLDLAQDQLRDPPIMLRKLELPDPCERIVAPKAL